MRERETCRESEIERKREAAERKKKKKGFPVRTREEKRERDNER